MNPEQRRGYRERGFLFPVVIASPAEVAAWRASLEALDRSGWAESGMREPGLAPLRAWLRPIVTRPAVLAAAGALVGPGLRLQNVDVFYKSGGLRQLLGDRRQTVMPHIDSHLPPAQTERRLTAWIPLGDVDRRRGALAYLPGSHRALPFDPSHRPDDLNVARADLPAGSWVNAALKAGEMTLHHARTVHRSGLNRGARPRIGLAIRYSGAAAGGLALEERFAVCWRVS